ncbi:uncharacterized protein EI90DRAFT_3014676 [Cantharellus anzutake]|uniref:uncharacterized protein n=1 Tax=Cantharellus anzutake TaxID=1750568 RepID=UPI0019080CA1|nr:uncharacterized protein EI90DRAFT_3014676 [Cantharellus anzutake]KAF8335436.1 hypothetical protein EI90DRAFT_3014676 [Cantharellus anzutake]
MDRRKRRPSTDGPEPHPPKRRSPMAPDDNQQSSAPSSLLDPSQTHPANPLTLQTGDNSLHDWHSGAYVVAHGTATSSGDSYPLSSVTMLPGLSYSHPHLHSFPPSHQVLPADPQALQSCDIPHDWRSRSVEPYLGVPAPAPAFGPSGDHWPFPIPELELPDIYESDSQSHALVSSLDIYPISSQTPYEGSRPDRWDGSMESHPEISQIVAPWSPSGGLRSLAPDMRTWRSNVNSISQSSTPVLGSSVPTTPASSIPAHSDQFLYPPSAPSLSETACANPDPWAPYGNSESARTQLEHAMNLFVPPVSEPTTSSSAGPSEGKKESIISATRLILQTASSALKFSPVPFLPNIPDSLLMLLQVYENVSSNNKALKWLNDDVQMKELHLALEGQVQRIKSLQSQNRNLFKKIFNAGLLAQSITDVRTSISVALSRFAVHKI